MQAAKPSNSRLHPPTDLVANATKHSGVELDVRIGLVTVGRPQNGSGLLYIRGTLESCQAQSSGPHGIALCCQS